ATDEKCAEAWSESHVLKRRLADLAARNPTIGGYVAGAAKRLGGVVGDPASFAALEELLEAQAYRPCFWRVASDEINYRRFFDVNELAAVATERPEVFRAVHRKLLEWLAAGEADGLRIDHPDGLFDPRQYLERLQAHYLLAVAKRLHEENPAAYPDLDWPRDEGAVLERLGAVLREGEAPAEPLTPGSAGASPSRNQVRPLYVVVEKI